ncbi:MAG: hypothetical protein Q9167_001502 [Letrouitia subvulpina]
MSVGNIFVRNPIFEEPRVRQPEPFVYRTTIGIGTSPVQEMRALVDIDSVGMIIPSINCTSCSSHWKYNSTLSSSYEPNGTEFELSSGAITGKGILSLDTITLGDYIQIPKHEFLEASQFREAPFLFEAVDTTLSLAIDSPLREDTLNAPKEHLPGLLSTMKKENVLDRNIFSILLPRNEADLGEITFGAINDELYEGELSKHPLFPANTSDWQIEADFVAIVDQNGTTLFKQNLHGYSARLHTISPFIHLPRAVGEHLINATGADCSDSCHGCEVPCDSLSDLPNIVFGLGGHKIFVGAESYAINTDIQWPFCKPGRYCTLSIGETIGGEDCKRIELGWSFLRGVYSAYDFDSRNVYLGQAKHPS